MSHPSILANANKVMDEKTAKLYRSAQTHYALANAMSAMEALKAKGDFSVALSVVSQAMFLAHVDLLKDAGLPHPSIVALLKAHVEGYVAREAKEG
jgi:hypothetical protein